MRTGGTPEVANGAGGTTAGATGGAARTISGCCKAILAHFAIDPEAIRRAANNPAVPGDLCIGAIDRLGDHLAMTLFLPMPYGTAQMTVSTIDQPRIILPGMSLSPMIAASAIGQPIGRLTGHPAFAGLDHLLVTRVEAGHDCQGRPATLLHFEDQAEPLHRANGVAASRLLH